MRGALRATICIPRYAERAGGLFVGVAAGAPASRRRTEHLGLAGANRSATSRSCVILRFRRRIHCLQGQHGSARHWHITHIKAVARYLVNPSNGFM